MDKLNAFYAIWGRVMAHHAVGNALMLDAQRLAFRQAMAPMLNTGEHMELRPLSRMANDLLAKKAQGDKFIKFVKAMMTNKEGVCYVRWESKDGKPGKFVGRRKVEKSWQNYGLAITEVFTKWDVPKVEKVEKPLEDVLTNTFKRVLKSDMPEAKKRAIFAGYRAMITAGLILGEIQD